MQIIEIVIRKLRKWSLTNKCLYLILGKACQLNRQRVIKSWKGKIIHIDEPVCKQHAKIELLNFCDEFLFMDEMSEDVRGLLNNNEEWFAAQFTNNYSIHSDSVQNPTYKFDISNDALHIKGQSHPEHWVYLVSKRIMPKSYSLEFDFIAHSVVQEHLQICFASNSLAKRFRYIISANHTLFFDVVDHAIFFPPFVEVPFGIPLHKLVRVRLDVDENIFSISFDGKHQMSVKVNKPVKNGYLMFLFWNADTSEIIDVELRNAIIYTN